MRFLKKDKIPSELPDLAISAPTQHHVPEPPKPAFHLEPPRPIYQKLPVQPNPPVHSQPVSQIPQPKKEIAGEDYLEFANVQEEKANQIKKHIDQTLHFSKDAKGFFDTVLEDINGEIQDLGKLEAWYEQKFLPQDVVTNMRTYWEDNKADMIIKSFGAEFKQRITEQVKTLQELEADWREIYFRLIKKEEDMKKEEKALKETLSEFVELCKRRKTDHGQDYKK